MNDRYVSGFLSVILVLSVLPLLSRAALQESRRATLALLLVGAALLDIGLVMRPVVRHMRAGMTFATDNQGRLASALLAAGQRPGEDVAVVFTFDPAMCSWAQWSGAHIVGEAEGAGFWKATPAVQAKVLDLFREAGADYVVTDRPDGPAPKGWTAVTGTDFYFTSLKGQETAVAGTARVESAKPAARQPL